ncbi:MAG: hypothetical protein PVF33_00370 [Candidatus Latescibacterota bacterium]
MDRSPLPEATRRHLAGCEQCRLFRSDLELIQRGLEVDVPTPPAVRERTLAKTLQLLQERPSAARSSKWRRLRGVLDSPRFVAAAASLGVVALVTWMSIQAGGSADDEANLTWKLAIFQLMAQNVYAALFLPALLLLRNRPTVNANHTVMTGE